MDEFKIFIFYLVLIIGASLSAYKYSNSSSKMVNSLYGAITGSIVSLVLWKYYGQYVVTS